MPLPLNVMRMKLRERIIPDPVFPSATQEYATIAVADDELLQIRLAQVKIGNAATRAKKLLRCCGNIQNEAINLNVEHQLARLSLWISNIDCLAENHNSLDYRLRTAPLVKAAVVGNLNFLCKAILLRKRPPSNIYGHVQFHVS
jgi:hypothetical protein